MDTHLSTYPDLSLEFGEFLLIHSVLESHKKQLYSNVISLLSQVLNKTDQKTLHTCVYTYSLAEHMCYQQV